MNRHKVSLIRYEEPGRSVRRAVELVDGLAKLKPGDKVFIKPNVVFWTRTVPFPKWGVVTTSRVVEDMVVLLKDMGVSDITIGEGIVTIKPKDKDTPAHAFETLGYGRLARRHGVKVINTLDRPFRRVESAGVSLNYSADALDSDFLINLPVLKAHAQTVTSLGIKNLKGLIDINSRKKCHSPDLEKNLHYMIAHLPETLPPGLTLIDGIYSLERGPGFDGRVHRTNLLLAATDLISLDKVGALVLGYQPGEVPHLVIAAANHGRGLGLDDVEVLGEKIEDVARRHEHAFPYNEDGSLPLGLAKMGIQGLNFRQYDDTMCTYCSIINGAVIISVVQAWQGKPWPGVEVLTGKRMQARPGYAKTILLGKCICQANQDNPHIQERLAIKSCPPKPADIIKAFHQAGIELDSAILDNLEALPGFYLPRYEGKPEFDENLFRVVD